MNTAYKVFEVIDREILIPSKAQKINVSTDVNAEKLVLKMPQFYGDLDLTTLDIVMYIQGADISDIVAIRGYEVQGGFIVWEFVPQGAMLSKDGYINIQISGIKIETGTMSVKWQSKIKENAFYINRSMTGIVDSQVTPLPTELEQYRAEIIALISSVNLNRVVMDVTADTENVIVLHRGDGTQSPVHLTVSGGLTPTDLSNAIDNHNVGVNTHANIRKAIIDGDKAIDDKVSILSTLAITSKEGVYDFVDISKNLNNLKSNLMASTWQGANLINLPQGEDGSFGKIKSEVSFWSNNTVKCVEHEYINEKTGVIYRRSFTVDTNVWTKWQTIATTDKIDILIDAKTGFIITSNTSYKINNLLYFNLEFKKADGSAFQNTSYFSPALVVSSKPTSAIALSYTGSDVGGNPYGVGSGHLSRDGSIYVANVSNGITVGKVSGVCVI